MSDKPLKILVIDDNPCDQELLSRLLRKDKQRKFLLIESYNARDGLEKCLNDSPDCVLLDYLLPDSDGLEFLLKLLELKGAIDIPVIMLTGQGDERIAVKAMKLGVQDYLIKEKVTYNALSRVIHTSIEKMALLSKIEKQHTLLKAFKKRMDEELEQARIAQLALLPQKQPDNPYIEIAAKFIPMDEVGGDYYDWYELKDERVGLVIADVTGHGVPAALISSMTAGLFKTHAPLIKSPLSLLNTINDALYERIPDQKFVTAFYCTYDPHTRILTYSSAGHPPLYILRSKTKELITLSTDGMILGVFLSEMNRLTEKQIELIPGDKVFFYTDGIVEITNAEGIPFGIQKLESFLVNNAHLSIEALLEAIYSSVLNFSAKTKFDDDITLLGLEIV